MRITIIAAGTSNNELLIPIPEKKPAANMRSLLLVPAAIIVNLIT
jgi:hypothetical protein